MSKDKKCPKVQIRSGLVLQNDSTVENRRETLDGREYLVSPVIALIEGVVNGEFVSSDEIGRYVEAWNGIPLPIGHPTARGVPISANCPDILERNCIGQFFNARIEGTKLKGELWIDIAKAESLGGDAMEIISRLEEGRPLEVSTAYYRDLQEGTGTFNGRDYNGVQTNLRPDHLALLPNEIGACSWEDGCGGPRTNNDVRGTNMKLMKKIMADMPWLNAEEISHDEIYQLLESEMTKEYAGDPMAFIIRERYDEYIIYQEAAGDGGFTGQYFKRSYVIDEDTREVTFGTPVPVTKTVDYIPVTAPGINTDELDTGGPKNNNNKEKTGETTMEKEKLIDSLIANEATKWGEEDREFLAGLTEEQIDKIGSVPVSNEEEGGAGEGDGNGGEQPTDGGAGEGEGGEGEGEGDEEEPKSFDEWVDEIPDEEIREEMKANRKRIHARREALIKELAANKKCHFDKSELEGMKTNHLEKLSKSIATEDYSGKGGPRGNTANEDNSTVPIPGAVLLRKNDKE